MKHFYFLFAIAVAFILNIHSSGAKYVYTWGYYLEGQLGGRPGSNSIPNKVGTLSDWKFISAKGRFVLAIRNDGTLWGWGPNSRGSLGYGTDTIIFTPVQIGSDNDWKYVAAGFFSSYGIKNDGSLWAWGNNVVGELGDGTYEHKYIPTRIGNDNDWMMVDANGSVFINEGGHVIALKTNGTLWAWGRNGHGQLGDGTTINKIIPIQIGTSNDWKYVSAGTTHNLAIKNDGTLWAWGSNIAGQLGDGTTISKLIPTKIGTSNDWKIVKAHLDFSLGIKNDGTLWAWGHNGQRTLGDGTNIDKLIPTQIGNDNNWIHITSGGDGYTKTSAGIKSDGTLWTWGNQQHGQLGNGLTSLAYVSVPTKVGNDYKWSTVVGGAPFMAGLQHIAPVITIQTLPKLCPNTQFTCTFNTSGYEANNIFTLQLSDENGSFNSPTILGTLQSSEGGQIVFTAPENLVISGSYKIRIVTSNPYNISDEYAVQLANYFAPPSIQARSILFSNVTSSSIRVKWTNGNGERRIVLAKQGNSISETPVDGIEYTANSVFGNGDAIGDAFVVYNGTGNFVNVTGLSPNTNYTFKVFELVNNTPCILYNTNNSTMNPRTRKTSIAPPTIITNYDKGTNYFTAKWSYGGDVSYFEVDVSTNNLFTTYLEGWQNADVGELTEIEVTGLSVNTVYYYRVRAIDVNGVVSEWSNIANIRTLENPPSNAAINAIVSAKTPNAFTLNWNNNGNPGALVLLSSSPITASLTNGRTYFPNSNYSGNGEEVGNAKVVYNSSSNSVTITGLNPNTTYYYAIYTYNGSYNTGNENYHSTPLTGYGNTLLLEPTEAPNNITFTNINTNSLTINWIAGNGEKSIVLAKQGIEDESSYPTGYCTPYINYPYYYYFGRTNINNGEINHSHPGYYSNGYSNQTENFQANVSRGQIVNFSLTEPYASYQQSYSIWVDWNRDGDFNDIGERVAFSNSSGISNYSGNFTVPNNAAIGKTRIRVHSTYFYYNSSIYGIESTPCSSNFYGEYIDYTLNIIANLKDGDTYVANNSFGSGSQIGDWFVVYQGNGNSANISNLNPNTLYSFKVYTFNGENGSENYLDIPATATVTTQAAAPTIPPSNINFSNITANSMNVNWTPGNGQNTMILANTINSFTAPTNNTEYFADSDYSSDLSSVIGTAKVVYAGNGSNFNLTGLEPNTTYYLAAYSYNGSGSNSAFLTTAANGNETTLYSEPTTPPSNINFSNNYTTSVTVNWTPGNGTNSIVLAYNNTPSGAPVDGTSYTASSNFGGTGSTIGNGKVVYIGSGNSVNVTGLNPGTMYYFRVYTFNGSGNKTNYLNTPANGSNQTLLAANKLVITSISPTVVLSSGEAFSLTIQARDANNNPAYPLNNTTINITTSGAGTLSGTLSGTINTNQTTITINNIVYTNADGEDDVQFNAIDAASILLSGSINGIDFLAPEPSMQERLIVFSNVTQNQITATWTKGNGNSRILVVRQGSPVSDFPVDGVEYNANSVFGTSGTELGSGYVVYNNTDKQVTVTGLTNNVTYHFRAFGYNGLGSKINYNTSTGQFNPRSRTTLAKSGDFVGQYDETMCDIIGNSFTISEISPNPTTDQIKFTLNNTVTDYGDIVLMNSEGKEVKQIVTYGIINQGNTEFITNISDLPSGLYILYARVGECIAIQKFIVNK